MSNRFIGERLLVARNFRGLTQIELAEKVIAPHSLISYFEKGQRTPTGDLIEAISHTLGFEPNFFYEPQLDEFKVKQCNFRHSSTTSEMLKKRILSHCSLLTIVIDYLKTLLELPNYNVPSFNITNLEDIKKAADYCRQKWGLTSNAPIDNMIRVLEHAGVITHRHTTETKKIDAFSRFGNVTIVILNEFKQSSSRSFWDAAHELGHLVMHHDSDKEIALREKEADLFAAEFLLPRSGFTRDFGLQNKLDWDKIFKLKERWKTSVAATIHRAYDLRLIDAIKYRTAFKYIRYKGWHKGEPCEPEQEKPELLKLAFEKLENESHIRPIDVAHNLYYFPITFEEITGINIPRKDMNESSVTSLNHYRDNR